MEDEGICDEHYLLGLWMLVYFDDAVAGRSECTPLRDRATYHAKLVYGDGWNTYFQTYTPYWRIG